MAFLTHPGTLRTELPVHQADGFVDCVGLCVTIAGPVEGHRDAEGSVDCRRTVEGLSYLNEGVMACPSSDPRFHLEKFHRGSKNGACWLQAAWCHADHDLFGHVNHALMGQRSGIEPNVYHFCLQSQNPSIQGSGLSMSCIPCNERDLKIGFGPKMALVECWTCCSNILLR